MIQTLANRKRLAVRALVLAPAVLWTVALAQQPAGVSNFHKVSDTLYRGGQPTTDGSRISSKSA
jgi:hypothetical protein